MKKILLTLSLFGLSTSVFAQGLNSYNQIETAAVQGKPIHIVTDFTQCSPANKLFFDIGIFTPNEIIVTNNSEKHTIAAALLHFTHHNPAYPNRPIFESVTYTITPETKNSAVNVNLEIQLLDATNYSALGAPTHINCQLDAGAKIYL